MSTYSARKGPNMSQFIANLNQVDSQPADDLFNVNDDLNLFATTDFFDFDMGELNPLPGHDFDVDANNAKSSAANWQAPSAEGQSFLDTNFTFDDLNNFGSLNTPSVSGNGLNYSLPSGQQSQITSPSSATSPSGVAGPRVGDKRKLALTADESARLAAEEDKRRRNTAASARFRVKKKQREQALEKTAKEMTEKAAMLETKVQQLEMENKWLKGLITEREVGGGSKIGSVVSKGTLEELFEKYKSDERSKHSENKGDRDD
ncbi:uncharacterized protein PV09_03803 [Verruconis gallopava]|uniref:BZIP domain-containing protein n=1 Tax=Verruconis gallopava TaxID=253628 RepID=A0A0D1XRF2_9PEZI|nr:uncharacterized protein PV09_03803 [Verruconis gallopava]KIW05271.1 hypothetical protein PV09_03803 [Verruconis gallopava]